MTEIDAWYNTLRMVSMIDLYRAGYMTEDERKKREVLVRELNDARDKAAEMQRALRDARDTAKYYQCRVLYCKAQIDAPVPFYMPHTVSMDFWTVPGKIQGMEPPLRVKAYAFLLLYRKRLAAASAYVRRMKDAVRSRQREAAEAVRALEAYDRELAKVLAERKREMDGI